MYVLECHMDELTKRCSGPCGMLRPLTDFGFRNRALERRHTVCRACYKAWNRSHYERHKARYIANARRNTIIYRATTLRLLVEFLRQHPCTDCGESDPAEIAKCDVRC